MANCKFESGDLLAKLNTVLISTDSFFTTVGSSVSARNVVRYDAVESIVIKD